MSAFVWIGVLRRLFRKHFRASKNRGQFIKISAAGCSEYTLYKWQHVYDLCSSLASSHDFLKCIDVKSLLSTVMHYKLACSIKVIAKFKFKL